MADIKSTATYTVEITAAELALIRRALRLVNTFGDTDDWTPAAALLGDLEDTA
ncbi:hypothetical protein [Streptomyces sp. SM8]|uniref:hypothetical protein n=1 Tax=Streptomyces sp. SM8 TaxID=1195457 RepID=UPI0002831118|nr:hypothetical protein [Streptomyces sp. SM8]